MISLGTPPLTLTQTLTLTLSMRTNIYSLFLPLYKKRPPMHVVLSYMTVSWPPARRNPVETSRLGYNGI